MTAPSPTKLDALTGDTLDHFVCYLDEDTALCGQDVSGMEWGVIADDPCKVCADFWPAHWASCDLCRSKWSDME